MLDAVTERKYEYGESLKEGDALLISFIKSDSEAQLKEQKRLAVIERVESVKERLRATDRELAEAIDDWKAEREGRAQELSTVHERQIEQLEQRWADPGSLVKFAKPSPRLQVLRTTERRLAVLQLFERARRIRAEADRLESQEAVVAQTRAVAGMRAEYANLEAKQRVEAECLAESTAERLETLEQRRAAQVKAIQLVMTRLSETANPAVVPSRNKTGVWPERATPETPRPLALSPDARKHTPAEPLALSGLQLRQHVKIKKVDFGTNRAVTKKKNSEAM
jgi:hypothetical protein